MTDFTQSRVYLPTGTLSTVRIGDLTIYAVERTLDDPDHPCIPEARYALEPHHGPKSANGPIWAFVNPDVGVFHSETVTAEQLATARAAGLRIRTDCLFGHLGNSPKDVVGCDAFGTSVPDWTKPWVNDSHDAVHEFQAKMTEVWTPERGVVIGAAA